MTAKSTAIKGLCSRFGGCAVATPRKQACVGTPGEGGRTYLGRSAPCLDLGAEPVARRLIAAQKSAEGIVGGQVAHRLRGLLTAFASRSG